MSRAALTQRTVERAVRGLIKGGFEIGRVEVDGKTGRVIFLPVGASLEKDDAAALDAEIEAYLARGEG